MTKPLDPRFEQWLRANCGPTAYGDRNEHGVDLGLIRANLLLTPLERLRRGDRAMTDAQRLRRHAKRIEREPA